MGQYETIRGNVADVYVVNDDISATAEITSGKLATSVGRWASGSWVSGSQTVFTGTAAFTVLEFAVQVTAAVQGVVTFKEAGGTVIMSLSTSAAFTVINNAGAVALNGTIHVFTASNSLLLDVTAGNTIVATAVNTAAGKWYMQYIATQT